MYWKVITNVFFFSKEKLRYFQDNEYLFKIWSTWFYKSCLFFDNLWMPSLKDFLSSEQDHLSSLYFIEISEVLLCKCVSHRREKLIVRRYKVWSRMVDNMSHSSAFNASFTGVVKSLYRGFEPILDFFRSVRSLNWPFIVGSDHHCFSRFHLKIRIFKHFGLSEYSLSFFLTHPNHHFWI